MNTKKTRQTGNVAGKHQESRHEEWREQRQDYERGRKRWKGYTLKWGRRRDWAENSAGERARYTEWGRERGDSCRVSRWLSSVSQRQTPFSNPIVSAGRHPAPLCNPVNTHPIPSRKHTHTHSLPATHTRRARATHALKSKPHTELLPHMHTTGKRHRAGMRSWKTHKPTQETLTKHRDQINVFSLADTPQ